MPVGKGAEDLMVRVLGDDLPGVQTGFLYPRMPPLLVEASLLVLWLAFGPVSREG